MVLGFILITLAYAISAVITVARLYAKAGRPAWAAIVPFYNVWVMSNIAESRTWIAWVAIISEAAYIVLPKSIGGILGLVGGIFYLVILRSFILKYDRSIGFWILWIVFPIVTVFTVKNAHYKGALPTQNGPQTPANPAPQFNPTAGQPPLQATPFTQPQPTISPAQPVVPQTPQSQPFAQAATQQQQAIQPIASPQSYQQPFPQQTAPAVPPVEPQQNNNQ